MKQEAFHNPKSRRQRVNDPDGTKRDIIDVATEEFSGKGFSGARVDNIAARTKTSKRMIYYYFGSKDGLYIAVLEAAYRRIRTVEATLDLATQRPEQALRALIAFTFDYQNAHPEFVRLVMNENILHDRNFPGQGDLPLIDFMEALTATGYDGPLSLEIFNDQFRAGSARSVAVDGHRSLLFLLDQLASKNSALVPASRKLPSRSKTLGAEFVEFAVDEVSASKLESVLSSLGFRRAGRHKSKAVTRWQQGAINLVVNTDKEGFAHSFNLTHGSAVCALGMKVDNAAATLERAKLLLDDPFRQPVGPGELDIPAVRGVGGSLVYFLDATSELGRVWDIEFEPTGEVGSNAAGLMAIDHISQSMHYEEMLTWLLFYTSLLDLKKIPPQDVADPGGLVRSQVIESPDGRLRVILNASQSQRTQSSRFLTELFGSGVQHLAFSTADMFATAAQLKRNGVALLQIPDNYYDDLEAKMDLKPEQLAALRAHNILYDRDGDGEYLQVYAQTFEQRFFFEIVERRHYAGYGAANAPVRLAAQARLAGD